MKDLLTFLAKNLTQHPDQVSVEETEEDGLLRLQLTVSEDDKGRVIGRQGKLIKAIRSLVSAAAARQGKRSVVDVE